jgi:hypothetical protein
MLTVTSAIVALVPHSISRRRVENFIFLTVEEASKSVLAVG